MNERSQLIQFSYDGITLLFKPIQLMKLYWEACFLVPESDHNRQLEKVRGRQWYLSNDVTVWEASEIESVLSLFADVDFL